MQISIQELKKIISEVVKTKLEEANLKETTTKTLQEGPQEIAVRQIMLDLKDVVVGSIVEDITREVNMEETVVEKAVSRAYENMVYQIVRELDIPRNVVSSTGPVRRKVVPMMGGVR